MASDRTTKKPADYLEQPASIEMPKKTTPPTAGKRCKKPLLKPEAGLEPAIPDLEGRYPDHWTTQAFMKIGESLWKLQCACPTMLEPAPLRACLTSSLPPPAPPMPSLGREIVFSAAPALQGSLVLPTVICFMVARSSIPSNLTCIQPQSLRRNFGYWRLSLPWTSVYNQECRVGVPI